MEYNKLFVKPWLRKRVNWFFNPHFWAIVLLELFLTLFYYQTYFFGHRWLSFFWSVQITEFNFNVIGSLFCIPLVYAALVFWWKGAFFTWLISIIIILPQILTFRSGVASCITNILYSLIPLVVVIIISLQMNWRNKERNVLADRENERQNYISQVFKAQEDERKRISQEIHDDSIQRLAGVASIAQILSKDKNLENYPVLIERAESVRDTIISISQDLRRLSIDLRPTVLDDLGLIPSLYWLVDRCKQESGIDTQIEILGEERQLSKKITVLIFRIVQEALNNAKRHSKASQITVTIQFTEQTIKATIRDNGNGFRIPKSAQDLISQGRLGMIGMQQRTQALNGIFNILSEPGKGTAISVEVSLEEGTSSKKP